MSEVKAGCSKPVTVSEEPKVVENVSENTIKEEKKMIKVGTMAPDFQMQGYHEGAFKDFKLSDYRGKWVLLCFYPGDFTFV